MRHIEVLISEYMSGDLCEVDMPDLINALLDERHRPPKRLPSLKELLWVFLAGVGIGAGFAAELLGIP